jgi:hypothetical protein
LFAITTVIFPIFHFNNRFCPSNNTDDTVENFQNDTIKSPGTAAQRDLIQTLTTNSGKTITFPTERAGIALSLKLQSGGYLYIL